MVRHMIRENGHMSPTEIIVWGYVQVRESMVSMYVIKCTAQILVDTTQHNPKTKNLTHIRSIVEHREWRGWEERVDFKN